VTDDSWDGNRSAGSVNGKACGSPGDDLPSSGVSHVDPFGFLSECETRTDPDRSAGCSGAKDMNGGSLRPGTEIDDTFPSEETEPPPTPRRDESVSVPDTDFPVESRRDLAHGYAGRLLLTLAACALAVAAFVVTQQALGRTRLPAPAGMAVPARVSEEPPSSPTDVTGLTHDYNSR
jgi:hypothetical protein